MRTCSDTPRSARHEAETAPLAEHRRGSGATIPESAAAIDTGAERLGPERMRRLV